jgi:carbonic anhydrase
MILHASSLRLSPLRAYTGLFAAALVLSGLVARASGGEQSPIDIITADTVYQALPPLKYTYGSSVDLHVINTGSPDEEATVRAELTSFGDANSLLLSGETYHLLQFHFHTKAEHLLDGKAFDMELHLVHEKAGSTDVKDLLVTAVYIEAGDFNPTLEPIFADLPPDSLSPRDITGFDIASLLPHDLSSYRYPGSLTTSPYTEGVQWVVLNEPIHASLEQLHAFETLFPHENLRLPQELDGRVVLTDVESIPEPGSMTLLALGFTALAGRACRRQR